MTKEQTGAVGVASRNTTISTGVSGRVNERQYPWQVFWSPLDEAVSQQDRALVSRLLQGAKPQHWLSQDAQGAHPAAKLGPQRRRWEKRLSSLADALSLLPDFYLELDYRMELSPWNLFALNLSHFEIGPSDTVRVWKQGSNLRIDSTLASYRKKRVRGLFNFEPRLKRRRLTTLFVSDSGKDDHAGEAEEVVAPGRPAPAGTTSASTPTSPSGRPFCARKLILVNHTKGCYSQAVGEELDDAEREQIVDELLGSDILSWDFSLLVREKRMKPPSTSSTSASSSTSTTATNIKTPTVDLNGYPCEKCELHLDTTVHLRQKGKANWIRQQSYQSYFGEPLEQRPGPTKKWPSTSPTPEQGKKPGGPVEEEGEDLGEADCSTSSSSLTSNEWETYVPENVVENFLDSFTMFEPNSSIAGAVVGGPRGGHQLFDVNEDSMEEIETLGPESTSFRFAADGVPRTPAATALLAEPQAFPGTEDAYPPLFTPLSSRPSESAVGNSLKKTTERRQRRCWRLVWIATTIE
eukprot:g14952.t1